MITSSQPSLFDSLHLDPQEINRLLEKKSAQERTEWAVDTFRQHLILSSSFGAQAAVCLHLATQAAPHIPVVFIDTGYHFPETYQFVDRLRERLKLNLKTYSAKISPAWFEARHGKLWEKGVEGLTEYNNFMKVEPMQRALQELDAWGWIAGLRRSQSSTRRDLEIVGVQDRRLKIHPIIDWTDKDVYHYLTANDLPYHPLWDQGYVSIGDVHSTRKLTDGMTEEETRFFGLKRECGLHESSKNAPLPEI